MENVTFKEKKPIRGRRAQMLAHGGGGRRQKNVLDKVSTVTSSLRPFHNFVVMEYMKRNGAVNWSDALRLMIEESGEKMGISENEFKEREDAENFVF